MSLAPAGDTSEAKRLGLKGQTTIEVLVGVQGRSGYLAEAKVTQSSHVPALDRAAMYAVRYSEFQPAICNGKPVPGKVVVRVALP